ncbi:hypothetical protein AXFE_02010 [Acidithrix ferrooxidans]|uniref:Uncharacterized protein n=1 Tax=Acidithrix ferrooxidans TaxID=1280514 RepID=A0A0D8HM47_9ACTN|nr:hypothetical protein AXFE_02010 [Acidithrix ferrooxidans]
MTTLLLVLNPTLGFGTVFVVARGAQGTSLELEKRHAVETPLIYNP